jgi:hypothetical protein
MTPLDLPFVAFAALGRVDADTAFATAAAVDAMPVLITLDLRSGHHRVQRSSGDAPLAAGCGVGGAGGGLPRPARRRRPGRGAPMPGSTRRTCPATPCRRAKRRR